MTDKKVDEAVGALAYLEKHLGVSPSVAQVADQMNVSAATAFKRLKRAVTEKKLVQREGQFMTLALARKFEELK